MKTLKTLKAELLADPDVRQAYDDLALEYEIARAIVRARSAAGLTQAQLAERDGHRPVVRGEAGKRQGPSGNEHSGQGRRPPAPGRASIWSKPSLDYPRRSGMLRAATGRLGLAEKSNEFPENSHLRPHGVVVWGYLSAPRVTHSRPSTRGAAERYPFLYARTGISPARGAAGEIRRPSDGLPPSRAGPVDAPRGAEKTAAPGEAHERERREQERMTEQLSRPRRRQIPLRRPRALWACSGQTTTARCSWRRGWLSRCGGRLGAPGSSC